MKKKYVIYAAGLFLLTACTTNNKSDGGVVAGKDHGQVMETSAATLKTVDDELLLNGDVVCDESLLRKLYIPCEGRVTGLRVEIGDHVTAGQSLAVVRSEGAADYRKGMNEAASELRLAQREYQMQKDMQLSGMASERDVASAQERVAMAKAELQRLKDVAAINGYHGQSNAVLTAPISGYVISKNIYNDSYVSDQNNDDPALEIADLSRVWVIGDVYESDIEKIRQGAAATVTTMAYPGETYQGRIDKIYSMLDHQSKTMKVRISLDNAQKRLRPGMFASIHVRLSGTGSRMCAVPSSAVVFENGHDYVMVEQGRKQFRRREVSVGHEGGGYSYITSGLTVGENVISKNALLYFNASGNE